MAEARERATAHIEAEEAIIVKTTTHSPSKEGTRRMGETTARGIPIHPQVGAPTGDTSLM